MHNHYLLFAFCAISALNLVSAHFQDEDPTPHISFTCYPPGTPTVTPEPTHALDPGQYYAKPTNNPLHSPDALIYGPTKVAQLGDFIEPPGIIFRPGCCLNDGCPPGPGPGWDGIKAKWGKHFFDVLHRNLTVQQVGFPFDIFAQFEKEKDLASPVLSEITRGGVIEYGPKDHEPSKRASTSHLEKKYIFPPDGRSEIFNTWIFPYNTVGHVGSGCTGAISLPQTI